MTETDKRLNDNRINEAGTDMDLSELYKDEIQDTVRSMQKSADDMTENYHDHPYTAGDIVRDIIMFFVTVGVTFGWLLIMQLIISFVFLSYIHMKFDNMLIVSIVGAVLAAVVYGIVKSRKYIRLNDEKTKRKELKKEQRKDV